jgi:LysM repeat protein
VPLQGAAVSPAPAKPPVARLASAIELPATSDLLAKSKSMVDRGDLLAARKMLNDALLTGTLSGSDTDAVKKQLSTINQTIIFSNRPFPSDPLGGVYLVKAGDKLSSIGNAHGVPFEFLLMINNMANAKKLRYGQTLKVINGPFHVVVSKSRFTLDVYLGSAGGPDSTYITTFPVGLGTDNSTPTGSWVIKNKVTHPAYFPPDGHPGGVLDPDDPKNPLGPCWMGLEGTNGQAVGAQSYGIHGTIDPASIGKQSSMGCIRLHNDDVEVVYKMLVAGKSTVVVKD